MVVGSHPHVTQGAEIYHGKPIVYSLGNFLFNGFDTPATLTGWLLEVNVDQGRGQRAGARASCSLGEHGVPHARTTQASSPCGDARSDVVRAMPGDR